MSDGFHRDDDGVLWNFAHGTPVTEPGLGEFKAANAREDAI